MSSRAILLLVPAIVVACSDPVSTPSRRKVGVDDPVGSVTSANASSGVLASAPWCGVATTFNAGLLPAGWTSTTSGGLGNGAIYDRVNSQSGGWTAVSIPGAVTGPLHEVRIQYEAYSDPTFSAGSSGMGRTITFVNTTGYFNALEGIDRYAAGEEFYRSELVGALWPLPSSSTVFKVTTKPAAFGIYRHVVTVRDGGFAIRSTNLVTGTVVNSGVMPMTGFLLADIQSLQFGVSSPDNPTWADNLAISCS